MKKKIKKAIVLGSSSGIGAEIADMLNKLDFNVIKTDRSIIDTSNLESVKKFVKKNPKTDVLVLNTGGPEQIKHISDLAGKRLIIMPVTNSGYGIGGEDFCDEDSPLKPISLYGKTKVRAEEYLVKKSNNYVSLRLATVFGISDRMRVDLLVNDFVYKSYFEKKIILFESNFRRNYIHIQDVADLITNICLDNSKYKNQIFNYGLEDANLTKLELAKKIQNHIKNLKIEIDEFASDPDKRDYIVSNAKILSTGWKTKYNLDFGIKQLIDFYSKNKNYYSNI